ncbi:gamma carbonic anhydrase family protein [Candidatus Formimonas warabiya]|uniref:gamma carbonic anhydrase family protein n=1 Tax=Formimonas warabiya TaxID=1761012 RepID=UPI001BE48848|nr:gamma carbonic anhydrase family protein [Candidatus Formimonas warabiya]
MKRSFQGIEPDVKDACFVAPDANLIGEVRLGKDASVWFHTTLRGDVSGIFVGERTNIQDHCLIHGDRGVPTIIGDDVSVGHGAILHGCTIGNGCLIGMGSIIMSRTEIGDNCIIGAGALVTEDKRIPSGSVVMGVPGKVVKRITEEQVASILDRAQGYVERGKIYEQEDKQGNNRNTSY